MKLKFILPTGGGKAEATLIRTLTPYSINAAKFCQEYNKRSVEEYGEGYLVTNYFWLEGSVEKVFKFSFGLPVLTAMLMAKKELGCNELYDLYRLYYLLFQEKEIEGNSLDVGKFFSLVGSYRRVRLLKRKLRKTAGKRK